MTDLDKIPTACSLTTAEFRDREATLLAQFRSAVIKTEELQDGFAFSLPSNSDSIELARKLIMAERECCPFLAFALIAQPNEGPAIVRVTGPDGTKQFLRTILCNTEGCT